MRDSAVWRSVWTVTSPVVILARSSVEQFANCSVRHFCLGVGEDPGVNSRSGGQESRDRLRDGDAPHLSVLRIPERQITVLAIVPAQCEELADARAGDQRELRQGLQLRHPLAGVKQSRLLIR